MPSPPRDEVKLERVLAALQRAADAGAVAPTNWELSALLGGSSTSIAVRYVQQLEAEGRIRVQRFHLARRVTIVETGKQTALPHGAKPGRFSAPDVRPTPPPPPPPAAPAVHTGPDGCQMVPPFRLFSADEEAAFDDALADGFSIETAARLAGRSLLDGYRQFLRICAELGEPPR